MIYIDILICINLIVNYFLLLAAGRLCRREPRRGRLFLSACLGAAYALILFAHSLPGWLLLGSKLAVSALMVRIGFTYLGRREYWKQYAVFFLVNFAFAGVMLALWLFVAPSGMIYQQGVVYFDISAVMLVTFTALSYGLTALFSRIFPGKGTRQMRYDVLVELGGRQCLLNGLVDTGNTLRDAYTGYPVAVCSLDSVRSILPMSMRDVFAAPLQDVERLERLMTAGTGNRFKLIPYSTVGFTGLLPAFRPDRMTLRDPDGEYRVEQIYLAVAPRSFARGDADILLSEEILPLSCGRGGNKMDREPVSAGR